MLDVSEQVAMQWYREQGSKDTGQARARGEAGGRGTGHEANCRRPG